MRWTFEMLKPIYQLVVPSVTAINITEPDAYLREKFGVLEPTYVKSQRTGHLVKSGYRASKVNKILVFGAAAGQWVVRPLFPHFRNNQV